MPNPLCTPVSAPKKLFRGLPLPDAPVKLFWDAGGLRPVKLLERGPVGCAPVKLLWFSSTEGRREAGPGLEEEMEERGPREAGREAGAEDGGVDLGVFDLVDRVSMNLLKCIVAVVSLFDFVVDECIVGGCWCKSVMRLGSLAKYDLV